MLKEKMKEYILKEIEKNNEIGLIKEELDYANKHSLIGEIVKNEVKILEGDISSRFNDIYIERSNKQTEEMIAEEPTEFLHTSISYLKENMNEFVYVESPLFDLLSVEGVSLEVDDVFSTYNVLLGLKIKKKYQAVIEKYFKETLGDDAKAFGIHFSNDEGLFSLNFSLNYVSGFSEEMSMNQAIKIVYQMMFKLASQVEES